MRSGPIPLDMPDVPLWLGLIICFGPSLAFFLVLYGSHVWAKRRSRMD